jgi:glycosyltransferase involved in cell wall biosynthesis
VTNRFGVNGIRSGSDLGCVRILSHGNLSRRGNLMKIAVVTPSYQTTEFYLGRCLSSVANQTVAATQYLVCDGDEPSVIPPSEVRLIRLPFPHGDNGNAARAIGSIAAIADDFDAIAYLDSDNWFDARHIESLLRLQRQSGAAVCTSGRNLYDLEGDLLGPCSEVDGETFVDTSCMMFFRPAFGVVTEWYRMAKPLAPICDRIVWEAVKKTKLSRIHSSKRTLNFTSRYAAHYRHFGRTPPANAKAIVIR